MPTAMSEIKTGVRLVDHSNVVSCDTTVAKFDDLEAVKLDGNLSLRDIDSHSV